MCVCVCLCVNFWICVRLGLCDVVLCCVVLCCVVLCCVCVCVFLLVLMPVYVSVYTFACVYVCGPCTCLCLRLFIFVPRHDIVCVHVFFACVSMLLFFLYLCESFYLHLCSRLIVLCFV